MEVRDDRKAPAWFGTLWRGVAWLATSVARPSLRPLHPVPM